MEVKWRHWETLTVGSMVGGSEVETLTVGSMVDGSEVETLGDTDCRVNGG